MSLRGIDAPGWVNIDEWVQSGHACSFKPPKLRTEFFLALLNDCEKSYDQSSSFIQFYFYSAKKLGETINHRRYLTI